MASHDEEAGLTPATDEDEDRRRRRLPILLIFLGVLLLAAVGAFVYYIVTKKPITTIPGVSAVARGVPPHFLFNIYNVSRPIGVAMSPDGSRLYVTESTGDRLIKVFDRAGQLIGNLSASDTLPEDRLPVYIAVGPDGTVYLVDQLRDEVSVFAADGKYMRGIKPPDAPWGPLAIATDLNGNIYVTDIRDSGQRVVVFDKQLKFVNSLPVPELGPNYPAYPSGVALDASGKMYLGLGLGNRVDVIYNDGNKYGSVVKVGSATIGVPKGVALDDQDRMYVVDATNGTVGVFDSSASDLKFIFTFGAFGDGDGEFRYPNGIATDRTGRVYVADTYHDRVQVWSY